MATERITLPSSILEDVFGKVSYEIQGDEMEVMFTIMVTSIGENWRTAVALDASISMRGVYGRLLDGTIPPNALKKYKRKGWAKRREGDGDKMLILTKDAYDSALAEGYLSWTENVVQLEARKFLSFLASSLDAEGVVSAVYWACGAGIEIEEIGDIPLDQCGDMKIRGPETKSFGEKTKLLPVLKHFDVKFKDAEKSFFVFITDGKLDDLPSVKTYTAGLAKRIEDGERNPVKCVLVGIGREIDENQMIELDDLETGTEIDVWDHKIAKDLRMIEEIFAELVDETILVTSPVSIFDDAGNIVKRLSDGLPGRVMFRMPKTSKFFELQVGDQARIRQTIQAEI